MSRLFVAVPLLVALLPGVAAAQPRYVPPRPIHASEAPRREQASFRSVLGIPVAQRLLQSDDLAARVRGVERLGAIGTPEAYDALVEALEARSALMRDLRVRLTAVRVLAGETKRDGVRRLLHSEVTDSTGADGHGGTSPIAGLLRSTAALALARGGENKAIASLVATLLRPGLPAEAAALALEAYPPESLEAFVEGRRSPASAQGLEGRKWWSPPLLVFLGGAGDLRAVGKLRALISEGESAGKTAAAVALAELGDAAALPVAREWAKRPDPKLKLAAAEMLVALDAPEAPALVASLLEADTTREDGLRLSLRAPSPSLAAPLARALAASAVEARPRLIAAIGRAQGVPELTPLLDNPETSTDAAFALATMPGRAARDALRKALEAEKASKGDARRLMLRAATVRELVLDDAPSGLTRRLRGLLESKEPADRAAATFGLVAIGSMSLRDALARACRKGPASCDAALVGAAARGALALPDGASSLEALHGLLRSEAGGAVLTAAGAALLAYPDGGELPTPRLALWAEAGGPLSPLAARALPARDEESIRGRVQRLLEGTDPVVRAHVALGLGSDPEPSAASLLTAAYRYEEDDGVRRAVVRALSRRTEVQRLATLAMARDLDPDEGVRSLARAALEGRTSDLSLRAVLGVEPRRSVAWITIRPVAKDAPPRAVRVARSDGLAVPVLADPDGVLLVPGLPPGPASILLDRP